jgi:hypothetical protein
MTTALNTLNVSDVPLVNPAELMRPMQYLIETGRGLAMLRGISPAELREIDHALWSKLDPRERVAVLVRFRCLIRVFATRRLADLLLHTGHTLIAPAVHAAASMRLNADYGFNAHKFERTLRDLLAQLGPAQSTAQRAA